MQVEVDEKEEKVRQVQFNVLIVQELFQKIKQKKLHLTSKLSRTSIAKELRAQGAYIAAPKVTKWYCISCAIHFKVLKIRSADQRRKHTKLRG